MLRQSLLVLALALLPAAEPRVVGAQITLEAGPVVGHYSPSGGGNRPENGPYTPDNFSTIAGGVEATIWLPHRLGVRGDAMYAYKPADTFGNPGGWLEPPAANITTLDLLATVDVSPSHAKMLWLGAGPGLIRHGGDAFRTSGRPTDAMAIIAAGAALPLNKTFILGGEIDGLFYRYGGIFGPIGGPPIVDESVRNGFFAERNQHDVMLKIVLAYRGQSR